MADVTFTVDGKKLTAPAGTLLIEACRKAGIEMSIGQRDDGRAEVQELFSQLQQIREGRTAPAGAEHVLELCREASSHLEPVRPEPVQEFTPDIPRKERTRIVQDRLSRTLEGEPPGKRQNAPGKLL